MSSKPATPLRRIFPLVVTAAFCLLLVCRSEAKGLVLVDSGQARATIVIAAEANDKVKTAATDLQAYIEKISGAKLPQVSDAEKTTGALVLVGKSKLTETMKVSIPAGLTNARREEGFLLLCKGDRLLLAGNDEGPYHGTEYAVYEFLNRLGVRWFMPGEFGEVVPQQTTLTFPEIRATEKPDFVMRNWWLHAKPDLAEQEKRWKIRNKMNPESLFATPGDSSARNILPESVYFKEHPEYFALNADGTRNPYLPNLTDPNAVEIAAGVLKDYFRKNPTSNSYGFAPDDGIPRDYNPETMKLNQGFTDVLGRPGVPAEVSTTEEWITFFNKVTAEVRKEFPDAYVATNGYANRNIPPQGVALDDHAILMFAAIWSCTLHAYDDDHCWQKVRQGQMLKHWCEMCKNVWIYGYNYQMLVSGLTPLPETRKLRRDFPLMKKWGVMGFLDETRNVWAECGIASRYLRARLEWNADANVEEALEDFYSKWYGKAAQPMRDFYDAIEDRIEKTSMHGHEDRVLPEVYTSDLLSELENNLILGEKSADNDTTKLHVQADRLIYEHLKDYVAMNLAEADGNWLEAAQQAGRMLELRKDLNAINPFFIQPDESGYHTGVWYWTVTNRQQWYQSLADKTAGKTGDLVATLPDKVLFRADPHDEGVAAEWYKPTARETDWRSLSTAHPYYTQGYEDRQGYPQVGVLWYRFKVEVPRQAKGKKVTLYAPTVNPEGWCWVNGQYVGHRGYREAYERPLPMEIDVTEAIRPGATNTIVFRINATNCPGWAPEGLMSRPFLYTPKGE